jgi:ABC-type glutathione transport system ATPase component
MSAPDARPTDPTIDVTDEDRILSVDDFSGEFRTADGGTVPVLRHVSFALQRHRMTAVVGETGSGKTLTSLAMLGLSPRGFHRTSGSIDFEGTDLAQQDERGFRAIRGAQIAMVFQDSRSALNPVLTIGTQLTDVCRRHRGMRKREARVTATELLARVRVPEPSRRMRQYPHELSGGTVQRIQLALALACRPKLLLLDEPTTGLDVTIQADILELILDLTRSDGMTACMVTHDLGVVAETCDDVVVMRAGEVRETGTCEQILTCPIDDYTRELLAASRLEVAAP